MDTIILNYLLLAITGIYSICSIVELIKGRGIRFRGILFIVLFVLVLIATIMGVDYIRFKTIIESWF